MKALLLLLITTVSTTIAAQNKLVLGVDYFFNRPSGGNYILPANVNGVAYRVSWNQLLKTKKYIEYTIMLGYTNSLTGWDDAGPGYSASESFSINKNIPSVGVQCAYIIPFLKEYMFLRIGAYGGYHQLPNYTGIDSYHSGSSISGNYSNYYEITFEHPWELGQVIGSGITFGDFDLFSVRLEVNYRISILQGDVMCSTTVNGTTEYQERKSNIYNFMAFLGGGIYIPIYGNQDKALR